jgi:hypothetical protein
MLNQNFFVRKHHNSTLSIEASSAIVNYYQQGMYPRWRGGNT